MNFFSLFIKKHNLSKHDGRALWKYSLNTKEFFELRETLQFANPLSIDPRDVALYYAQWWNKKYSGGKPSKREVFDTVRGNSVYNFTAEEFYKLARKGAEMLGVKWIKKQNLLYFRTLLLQGGLPLKHISENQGNYKAFLEAVLEEQPETIEDFAFKSHIIDLLPQSSQNDIIYENCLDIVKSILNDDGQYDQLLELEESLREITVSLKIKKASLKKKVKQSKPKNYWLLSFKNDQPKINLRLGLADKYTNETLSDILGFEAVGRVYQFYMDDNLICVFRKMTNGSYKTDWYNQENKAWDVMDGLPYTYVLVEDEKVEITDFIQILPNLEEPSLWSKFNNEEWRLIKGTYASNKEAALLFPSNWQTVRTTSDIKLFTERLNWLPFEGELIINTAQGEKRTYLSGVQSFDWIIQSNKPKWMLKSNLPVTQGIPKVFVYDDDGYYIKKTQFKIYIRKHSTKHIWQDVSGLKHIDVGCFDIKIEKGDLIAHDVFFNIGRLQLSFTNQSIHAATIGFDNPDGFNFKLYESILIQMSKDENCFHLKLNTEFLKIPNVVKGAIGYLGKKNLLFDLVSPFQGMAITDKDGQIIDKEKPLTLANLYGLRILSTPNIETFLKIKNSLQPDVIITKEIKESTQQVIAFKDEIRRLFYLADAMDYTNTVSLELSEGRHKETYKISGFSHMLDVTNQLENSVSLVESIDQLELFAVPVNCDVEHIEVIPLMRDGGSYTIPETSVSNQFIVISSQDETHKLMPRFVYTTDSEFGIDKMERIDNYHLELSGTNFKDDIWVAVLKYFNICLQYDIPFSTFDQLRALSRSSSVASRAFFFLGVNQPAATEYIQKALPEIEEDLGFCFHWVSKFDWEYAIREIIDLIGLQYQQKIFDLLSSYMGENGLEKLFTFLGGASIQTVPISQINITDLRSQLGERVLRELPYSSPMITDNYGIHIRDHIIVRLLLQTPIAVAESISNIQKEAPIWGGDDKRKAIRRNIQYSQYLCSLYPKIDFYNKTILHVLKRS